MERSLSDRTNNYGTSFGVEFVAIKDELEIELSTSWLGSSSPRQLSEEVIFKRPLSLTSELELDLGLGLSFGRRYNYSSSNANQVGGVFSAELMWWPTKKFGYYLNPQYNLGFGSSMGDRGIGLSAGVLFSL